jgi:DNA-binding NtrC family response regulator
MTTISDPKHDRRVLLVDDDPAILMLLSKALTKRGYTPSTLTDGEQVLSHLAQSPARIVVLDVDMPGKNGLVLLREIKKFDGSIQVIMLTGLASMGTILRATKLGAEECIFKPIEKLDDVADAVDRAYTKILRWWATLREWRVRKELVSQSDKIQVAKTAE